MPRNRLQDRPDTQGSILDISLSEISCIHPVNANCTVASTVLLQHCADPNIRNTDGKTALDLADPSAKAVLTGEWDKKQTGFNWININNHNVKAKQGILING